MTNRGIDQSNLMVQELKALQKWQILLNNYHLRVKAALSLID